MMPHERWCIRSENGPCARVTWLWYSSIGVMARLPNSSWAANGPNTEESNTRVVFGIDGLPAVRAVFTGNQGSRSNRCARRATFVAGRDLLQGRLAHMGPELPRAGRRGGRAAIVRFLL